MKIESEKLLDKKLCVEVKKLGGWAIKIPASHLSGLPDRLCLLPEGRLFFAEIKTTGKKPTRLQLSIHKRLANLGFTVHVVESSEQLEELAKPVAIISNANISMFIDDRDQKYC